MLEVHIAIDGDFEPIISETGIQSFVEVDASSCVFLGIGFLLGDIADVVVVAGTGVCTNVPMPRGVNCRVEGESSIGIPVAVDVFRTRDASSCLCVISHKVGDAVACDSAVGVCHKGAFVASYVVVVVDVERVGELRLQSWVSLCDVERVGVIGDVEQLGDVGLSGVASIVEPDVLLIAELIVEVDGRRKVHHVADGIDVNASIVLYEIRVLGL